MSETAFGIKEHSYQEYSEALIVKAGNAHLVSPDKKQQGAPERAPVVFKRYGFNNESGSTLIRLAPIVKDEVRENTWTSPRGTTKVPLKLRSGPKFTVLWELL